MSKQPYYITTAIVYTSKKPHIGNSYDIVLTDVIARYKRLMGYDVFFLTGTDEHGIKIEEQAKSEGRTPKELVDEIAGIIRQQADMLGTTYDKFIRTTDDYHEKAVQKIFKKLYEQGDIYKSEYEGLYCVPCESFWTESQLADGKCPDCGRDVEPAKEESYFFKLSKYADKLVKYYEENPNFVLPLERKTEMLEGFIKPGLKDLCVSRTSFKWGIPVDFDDKHVVYVWIDALANYITALGYDTEENSDLYRKYWHSGATHIIGKDIVRFHIIYWPIILMALGEPLPKQVYGHPWLLSGFVNSESTEDEGGEAVKMSKSRGNVLYADKLIEKYGKDAVRYYILASMPYATDGVITEEMVESKINTDLANTLGNLVSRTIAMVVKYFDSKIPAPAEMQEVDNDLINKVKNNKAFALIEEFKIADSLAEIIDLARACNKYIDLTEPWILAKNDTVRLGTVLYNLTYSIREIGKLLQPFIPDTADKIAAAVGETEVESIPPLFMRISG
jgi:methionyl-tRNA synthetase